MRMLIDRAHELRARLRELGPSIESARRVPQDLATELAEAGFFRMLIPKQLDGLETEPQIFVQVLEALGRGDGATGWITMTAATTGLLSAYLPEEGARTIFGDRSGIYAGVFAPMGRATPVEGGYKLSGRWPFASGVDNATWRSGGALVLDEGQGPRELPSGEPELRSFFFKDSDSQVIDTWKTSGLRGTGSHDLVVEDLFVPNEHTTCLFLDAPRYEGPLFRFPLFGLLALGVSAVGLGIAQAALDELYRVAPIKRSGSKKLHETELAQVRVATIEGQLRAARALLQATAGAAWENAKSDPISDQIRAELRLAACHAAQVAAAVTDAAYRLAGGGAIYEKSPLQRHLRDVHTMTQHIMVAEPTLKPIGRILFGLPTATAQL